MNHQALPIIKKINKLHTKVQIYFLFALLLLFFGINLSYAQGYKVRTVVIDAGHGGHDSGALGKNSKEKDLALAIALKTGKYIEERMPDVKVIYTRKTDKFVELYRRAQIANENHADLFISIHCNKHTTSRPKGAETFVLGLHRTEANLKVAKTENSVILLEEDHTTQYAGFDPNKDEGYIALSLLQSSNIDNSIHFADIIQREFTNRVGRTDRSVKQAGFLVLYKTTMPGVLIETGFLSNPAEEKFLLSKQGQDYMASAIFRAFREFKEFYEKKNETVLKEDEENQNSTQDSITEDAESSKPVEIYNQIATSSKPMKLKNLTRKTGMEVSQYIQNAMYKYIVGPFSSLKQAEDNRKQLKKKGFKDAFTVYFIDGKRVGKQEALKYL